MEINRDELIDTIIGKLLNGVSSEDPRTVPAPDKKRLLALVCGGLGGSGEAARQLKLFSDEGYSLKILFSDAGKALLGNEWLVREGIKAQTAEDSESPIELLKNADAVMVPVLTVNTAAKVACGIADTRVTTVLVQALLQERPVFAVEDACDPNQSYYHGAGKRGVLFHKRLMENIEHLRQYGVRTMTAGNLYYIVNSYFYAEGAIDTLVSNIGVAEVVGEQEDDHDVFDGRLLSAVDIRRWRSRTLKLPTGVIITAAARDLAYEKGIRIIEVGR